jgi:amino-acid N-acetyltransferase
MGEVQCLAVHNDFRRLGIGKQIVLACVGRARSLGICELMAITSNDEFLRECGFDYALPDQKRALFIQTSTDEP